MEFDDGAMKIADVIYKKNPLSTITGRFQKFQLVLQTVREDNKSFRNFKSRFDAQVCCYNSTSTKSRLSESLTAFFLISNAGVESNQSVSVLATAVSTLTIVYANQNFQSDVTYDSVASTIRACDKPKLSSIGQPSLSSNSSF